MEVGETDSKILGAAGGWASDSSRQTDLDRHFPRAYAVATKECLKNRFLLYRRSATATGLSDGLHPSLKLDRLIVPCCRCACLGFLDMAHDHKHIMFSPAKCPKVHIATQSICVAIWLFEHFLWKTVVCSCSGSHV